MHVKALRAAVVTGGDALVRPSPHVPAPAIGLDRAFNEGPCRGLDRLLVHLFLTVLQRLAPQVAALGPEGVSEPLFDLIEQAWVRVQGTALLTKAGREERGG